MRLRLPLLLVVLAACAHATPTPTSTEEGQRAATLFLKTLRWEGPRASASLLAPELQREYLDRIKADKLEDKLHVTEYEAKEASRPSADTLKVDADLSWYTEPEVTIRHETVTLSLRYRDRWIVEGVEGGPIPVRPLGAPIADGGAPEPQSR